MKSSKIDAEGIWGVALTYVKTVVDTAREPFLILDKDLRVISVNRTFSAFFQVVSGETEGKLVYELGDGQWNIPELKVLLEEVLPENTFFDDFQVEHDFPKIGHRIMLLNARRVHVAEIDKPIMLLAMEDITRRVQIEVGMKEHTKELALEVAKRTAELESQVKELERMNRIMIGREMKMIELKAELEKLRNSREGQ